MEYTLEERGEKMIQACMAETSCDPVKIFERLARHDYVRMHGPEHHNCVNKSKSKKQE